MLLTRKLCVLLPLFGKSAKQMVNNNNYQRQFHPKGANLDLNEAHKIWLLNYCTYFDCRSIRWKRSKSMNIDNHVSFPIGLKKFFAKIMYVWEILFTKVTDGNVREFSIVYCKIIMCNALIAKFCRVSIHLSHYV